MISKLARSFSAKRVGCDIHVDVMVATSLLLYVMVCSIVDRVYEFGDIVMAGNMRNMDSERLPLCSTISGHVGYIAEG
jgi:hypothetical protein